jgi:hypothetical protein
MDAREFRKEAEAGRVSAAELLDAIERLEKRVRTLERENYILRKRLEQYESPPPPPGDDGAASATDYSLSGEEKRQRRRRSKPNRRGRRRVDEKLDRVQRWVDVYPDGAAPRDCLFVRVRLAWRVSDANQAEWVGYRLYRRRGEPAPAQPLGLLPRCEYGIEIVATLAFLTLIMRLSLDRACEVLDFFWALPLAKSQANALLDQLAKHWEPEFDALCELIVLAAVLHSDETSWPVGKDNTSLWVFLSALHSVFKFGVHKDKATLHDTLPPELFQGVLISDDAAVYENYARAQKCWAHLLRKAIKLTLLYPEKPAYRRFLNDLLAVYRRALRHQQDQRLSSAGRDQKVAALHDAVWDACAPHQAIWENPRTPDEHDFSNLVYELFRLIERDELFTFVRDPQVPATNNDSERTQRGPALDRDEGRSSKTPRSARRRSVLLSVLDSLRKNLSPFRLASMLAELLRWARDGISLFQRQLAEMKARLGNPAAAMAGVIDPPQRE